MAKKKKKKMSKAKAFKTIVEEHVKIARLKMKIADRKQTNAAFKRLREGRATLADSSRLANAKALPKRKKR